MGAYLDLHASVERWLIDFSMKNMSAGQGTVFPTVGTTQGMIFYKTNEDKIYKLTLPSTWTLLPSDYFLFDFDAHAVQVNYPEHDIIGLKAFSVDVDEKLFNISTVVMLSIFNDDHMKRHRTIMDKLFDALYPASIIPVNMYSQGSSTAYDALFIANGTEVLPVVNSEVRVFQGVGISALTGVTAK